MKRHATQNRDFRLIGNHGFGPVAPKKLLMATLMIAFFPLSSQAAGAVTSGAGNILQEIQPVLLPNPSSNETGLQIQQQSGVELPPSPPFLVKTIHIKGNTLIDTTTLNTLVMDAEGQSLSLPNLNKMAARIANYYHNHGYPHAQAIIPVQTIEDGVVNILVVEARYGKVKLENLSRVNDGPLESTLSQLQSGQLIVQEDLEHSLLLLSDIPGVATRAILSPSDKAGVSDLLVQLAPGPRVTGNLTADDFGNSHTERTRSSGTVNFIDPLHHGDVLSAKVMSAGGGMNYGQVSYESLVNGKGTRLAGSYTALNYMLEDTLSSHGTAHVESLWAKHPMVRSHDDNLYGQLQYDHKVIIDYIDASGLKSDRHLDNWIFSLTSDVRDSYLYGGINTWSIRLTSGQVKFDDPVSQLADASSAMTEGSYSKLKLKFAREQIVGSRHQIYVAFSAQFANKNLDAAEKMVGGGHYTVRAYDIGAVAGDYGYLGSVELRRDFDQVWYGKLQNVTFIDTEYLTINKNPWAPGANSATLSGVGVGLNWAGPAQWTAQAYVAIRLGQTPELVTSNSSARAWFEVSKGF